MDSKLPICIDFYRILNNKFPPRIDESIIRKDKRRGEIINRGERVYSNAKRKREGKKNGNYDQLSSRFEPLL